MKRWLHFLLHLPLRPVSPGAWPSHLAISPSPKHLQRKLWSRPEQHPSARTFNSFCKDLLQEAEGQGRSSGCCGLLQSQQQNLFPEFITWSQVLFLLGNGREGHLWSKGSAKCIQRLFSLSFHIDISLAWRQVCTPVGMWVFCQNLPSPVQEFPGPPAPSEWDLFTFSRTGIYSPGLQVEEKKNVQSDSLSSSSIWRLQENLHCEITFICISFFYNLFRI